MIKIILLLFSINVIADDLVHIDQIGNNNTYNITQVEDNKTVNITGTVNNETISVLQTGSGQHIANVVFDQIQNSLPSNVSITQSGSANKTFGLQVNSQNVTVTVIQDNPILPNTGSMTIECSVGPCTGYSYISH
jgi:hypothetical protein